MNPYEEVTAEVDFSRINLEIEKFKCQYAVDDCSAMLRGLTMREFRDEVGRRMVFQLLAKVAAKKLEVKTVKFPDGPWEFVKYNLSGSRWYGLRVVRWFLKRYPVKFCEVTMQANAYYPDVAIPDHAAFVQIMVCGKREGRL